MKRLKDLILDLMAIIIIAFMQYTDRKLVRNQPMTETVFCKDCEFYKVSFGSCYECLKHTDTTSFIKPYDKPCEDFEPRKGEEEKK